jgi:hypothetical protein
MALIRSAKPHSRLVRSPRNTRSSPALMTLEAMRRSSPCIGRLLVWRIRLPRYRQQERSPLARNRRAFRPQSEQWLELSISPQ